MKILFLAHHKLPHIGGVEKHVDLINKRLVSMGHKTTIVSDVDINPPHIKFVGLLYIWLWLFKNRQLMVNADIVHIHDVFIWYLPFRFIFPKKKVFVTFHGWEGIYPIPYWNILNKRIANYLSNGSISVGKYINKYYGIKSDFVIYGATDIKKTQRHKKIKNTIVFLGRQAKDTGYFEFKEWLKNRKELKVKYVTNDPKSERHLKTAEYCVPSGYLSYLEAKSYGCKIITFANYPLKVDYWKEIKRLKIIPTWSEIVEVYMSLWKYSA